jgi:hypothetical protein
MVTVDILGADASEDKLTVRNEGSAFHQIGFNVANNVMFEGVQIGNAQFDASQSRLTVSFNDSDKVSEISVGSLLQNIQYNNMDSNNPTEGMRTLRFRVWDGAGASSGACDIPLEVRGLNDAPEIMNIHGDSVIYTQGDDPVRVDMGTNGYVIDVDNTEFGHGGIYIGLDNVEDWDVNGNSLERLEIRNEGTGAGQLGFEGFDYDFNFPVSPLYYEGVQFGQAASGTFFVSVDFNSNATPEAVSSLLRNITYEHLDSMNPTAGQRTIRFSMNDGAGDDPNRWWIFDENSEPVFATVNVVDLNDAPVIHNLGGDSITYTKSDGLKMLDQGLVQGRVDATVSDEDSVNFNGGYLAVEILNGDENEDRVDISTAAGWGIGLAGNQVYYNSKLIGTYTADPDGDHLEVSFTSDFAGTDAANALIRSIGYENTDSANPQSGDRVVRFTMYDGDGPVGTSAAYDTRVVVTGNRAPVVLDGIADWEDVILDAVNRFTIPDAAFDDPDGFTDDDHLTYTAELVDENGDSLGALPGWLVLSEDGTFTAMPMNLNDFVDGKISVKVTATDLGGLSAETVFDILEPTDINHGPVFDDANPAFLISEHEPITGDALDGQSVADPTQSNGVWTYTKLGDTPVPVKISASDIDGDTMTYRVIGGTGAGNFSIDANTGEITLTADGENSPEWTDDLNFETGPKAFTLDIVAEDELGAVSAEPATLVIFVADENDDPLANTIPIQTAKPSVMGDTYIYDVENPNSLWGQVVVFTDEDGDDLKYRAEIVKPAGMTSNWLTFDPVENRFYGKFPTTVAAGTYTYDITLYADDGEVEVGATFQLELIISDSGARDAVRYLDIYDGDGLPADAEEAMELNDFVMYAEAEDVPAEDAELYDVLALLEQQGFEPEDARA